MQLKTAEAYTDDTLFQDGKDPLELVGCSYYNKACECAAILPLVGLLKFSIDSFRVSSSKK